MEMKKLSTSADILKGVEARYNNEHDANMRLIKTIIRFEDRPYYVQDVVPGMWLVCWNLVNGADSVLIHANDSRLDVSSINVGFINHNGNAFYLARMPLRSQRQGFSLSNVSITDVFSTRGPRKGLLENTASVLESIRKSIEKSYPRLTELPEIRCGMAISRTWAFGRISKHTHLWLVYHRAYPVAIYDSTKHRFLFQKGTLNRLRYESLNNILAKQGAFNVSYVIEESN